VETLRNKETGVGNGSGRNTGKRSKNNNQSRETGWITADAMQGSLFPSLLCAEILGFPVLMCCYSFIDGNKNNCKKNNGRKSVLKKLRQKQAEIAKRSGKPAQQMETVADMERRRK